MIVCAVLAFPALTIVSGLVGVMLDSPQPDPTNPQDIPLWVFTATYYPYAWTPAFALLLAWLRLRRSSRLVDLPVNE
jgi:hypothetical protein